MNRPKSKKTPTRRQSWPTALSSLSRIVILSLLRVFKEAAARLRGQRFYCGALAGTSSFSPVIAADLSVSCNCADSDGTGILGTLSESTLSGIYHGEVAKRFRKWLARGRLPILRCVTCHDLHAVDRGEADALSRQVRIPSETVLIENNAGCNLECVACRREQRPLKKMKMSPADVERVSRLLAEIRPKGIAFYFLGEPFLSRNILDEIKTIKAHNPDALLHTSTNGMLMTGDRIEAAFLMDMLIVSIDGVDQESAQRYQVGMDFDLAARNLAALARERERRGLKTPYIVWRYVVFNWNDHPDQVARAVEMARTAGADAIEFLWAKSPVWGISWRFKYAPYWKAVAPLAHGTRRVRFAAGPAAFGYAD